MTLFGQNKKELVLWLNSLTLHIFESPKIETKVEREFFSVTRSHQNRVWIIENFSKPREDQLDIGSFVSRLWSSHCFDYDFVKHVLYVWVNSIYNL